VNVRWAQEIDLRDKENFGKVEFGAPPERQEAVSQGCDHQWYPDVCLNSFLVKVLLVPCIKRAFGLSYKGLKIGHL
jgi:hypothetical protein